MQDNPTQLRKCILEHTINDFRTKYPDYNNKEYWELLRIVKIVSKSPENASKYPKDFIMDLTNYILAYDQLRTYEGAQEFHITFKTFSKIHEMLSDLENYPSTTNFKDMKIPFENMLFTVEGTTEPYGFINFQCFKVEDVKLTQKGEKKDIYTVKVFSDINFQMDAYFVVDLLPRVFLYCEHCKTENGCLNANPNTLLFEEKRITCLKNHRTCLSCSNVQEGLPYASVGVKAVFMIYEVLKMFYKKPSFVYKVLKSIQGDKHSTTQERNKRKESNVITLTDKRYVYLSHDKVRENIIKRNSPCEHLRKAHERKLKDGRIIKIKELTISKGKGKKIIKV
jgi:hypothetical protein